ncbi:helix-turn-helix domain-containing protein [Candidatus Dojkabacteria bacterium]|uniref:Helix-turn-helix domain-containing protein n=1 Tax=Candidatus Dojkabacteria bacterium TaxID=2099670 RepID=A0A955RKY5_9BACT|nr:helix-turn-helix domain-containing protein [Candidatus Dojkabacteria bacterium]
MENSKKYYSSHDIAKILGISYNKVNKLVKSCEIPAYKIGGQYRVDKEDFNEYMHNSKVVKKEKKKTVRERYVRKPELENKWNIPLLPN